MKSSKLNFLFYSVGIAISGILSFLFIPLVVQLYGKGLYATYTIVFNILSIVSMFCYAWVGQSYIRFYSKYGSELLQISKVLITKSLSLAVIIFIILGLLATDITIYQLLFFIPTFFIFGYYCFLLLVLQAHQKAKIVMLCEVLRTTLNILTAFAFIKVFPNQNALNLLAIALFISYIIPTVILFYKTKTTKVSYSLENKVAVTKQLLSFGIPIAFFLSGSIALSANDRILLAFFIDKETAGTYAAIYDLINKGVVAIFSPILMTFYPIISNHYNNNEKQLAYKKLKKTILIEVVLIIFGFVSLTVVCSYLLEIIFNQQMPGNLQNVTYLIFIGVCLWQLAMLVHKPLELKEQTKYMAIAVLIAFVFNLISNIIIFQFSNNLIYPAITTILGSLIYITFVKYYNRVLSKNA
ncbi:MAG: lipopolysaccharide biosynthesis protein [Chitinophagaceae bacterium]